ncbi:MAG: transporter substrate-binding domain-containing protein [Desulfobacter sp.]|nr:MAG: transporter substrate-binding domain-containing protein [Desulfobacter sp.]
MPKNQNTQQMCGKRAWPRVGAALSGPGWFRKTAVAALILCLTVFFHDSGAAGGETIPRPLRKIHLVTDTWPPFYGPELKDKGFLTLIAGKAFHEAGYELSVGFHEWETAKKLARSGEADGILGAFFSRERKADFSFTLPITVVKQIFITRKDVEACYDEDLTNLKGFRIGITSGYIYDREFDHARMLNKIKVPEPRQLFMDLIAGRLDIIVISEQVAKSYLNNEFANHRPTLRALGPSLTTKTLHILISKARPDHRRIVADFNLGLKTLAKSGRLSKLVP